MLLKGDICRGDTAYIAYTDGTLAYAPKQWLQKVPAKIVIRIKINKLGDPERCHNLLG